MRTLVRSVRRTLAFLLLIPAITHAQGGRDKGVWCSVHGDVGACDGTLACDRLWAEHIERYHRGDGDSWSRVRAASFSPLGTPPFLLMRAGLLGGSVGALAGSLVMVDDTTSQALAGALAGFGTFAAAGVIANRGAWGPVGQTVVAAVAGAALGAGAGKFGERSPEGTPRRALEEERTSNMTTAGAITGTATGFTLSLIAKQEHWPVSRWFRPGARAQVVARGAGLGVRISW